VSSEAVAEIVVCRFEDLNDPDSREFHIGDGDWPFKGFVVRRGDEVYAYQNYCVHAGHPLNWQPNQFLTEDKSQIVCASHGAIYEIGSGVCISGPCPGKKLLPVAVLIRDGDVVVSGPTAQT
jgi:nitrite reductase/ring-hydroxylating ferredoxin subunit